MFYKVNQWPDIILSTHLEEPILNGIGYQGKSGWQFSTKEGSTFLLDPSVIWGTCHETSKDECSLSKIAEGLKNRPFVCIKNLQIFLRSLTLQMRKKEQ
jgi:hypothetical protein